MLENTIFELKTKIDKDLLMAGKMMGRLNELIAQYNTNLTITVGPKGIFADKELHYMVTTINYIKYLVTKINCMNSNKFNGNNSMTQKHL